MDAAGKPMKVGYTIAELLGVDAEQTKAETEEQVQQLKAGIAAGAGKTGVTGLFSDHYQGRSGRTNHGARTSNSPGDSAVNLDHWVPPTKAVTGGSGKSGA